MARKTSKAGTRTAARPRVDLALLGVLALTLAAYLPALRNDFVNWDDDHYVYNNAGLRQGWLFTLPSLFLERRDGGWALPNVMGNYHPLTMVSLQIDAWLGGQDAVKRNDRETDLHAAVFHATNVALHLANTVLVFLVVRALLEAWRGRGGPAAANGLEARPIALATAALFGVSTLHVESVAWVAERKDVLYVFFFLLALRWYLRYARHERRVDYWTALGLFLLSLLSKGQAVTLAPTLLLVDWMLGRPWRGRVLAEKAPFLALALVFGLIAVHAQREGGNVLVKDAVHPAALRPLFAAYGLVHYVAKLVFPYGLLAHYPYARATARPVTLFAFYLPVALALLAATAWLARRRPVLAFGPLFFLVNIAPVLQLLPVGSAVMADRYSYLPSLGIFLLLALGLGVCRQRWPAQRRVVDGGLALYLVLLAALTAARADKWRNSLTLWTEELRNNPQSAIAHNNIATFKYHTGDLPGALAEVNRALALDPDWHKALTNRAVMRDLAGDAAGARDDYDRTLSLRPDQAVAWNNRGKLKQEGGDLEGARADLSEAIARDPRAMYYVNRAEVLVALKRVPEAMADYTAALEREPGRHDLHAERAILRAQSGDTHGALEDFSEVVRLLPGSPYPYLNRARARVAVRDCAGARDDLDSARRLGPLPPDADRLLEACGS